MNYNQVEYDLVKIGKRIKDYRKKHDMTQEELASALADNGVRANRQTVYRIEKGEPGDNFFDILLILCDIFETDIGHLLGEHEERTQFIADMAEYTGLHPAAVEALNRHHRDFSPLGLGTQALNCILESKEFDEITERLATYLFGYSVEMIPETLPDGDISGFDSYMITNMTEYRNVIQPAQLFALGVCLTGIEKRCTKLLYDAEKDKQKIADFIKEQKRKKRTHGR